MADLYTEIRLLHVAAALCSGGLFFLRGLALFAGQHWPLHRPMRSLSYTIDTTLFAAGLILMTIVQQYPFVDAWLTMKMALLSLYIVLGFVAFWWAHTRLIGITCWVVALGTYGIIYSVARTHDAFVFLRVF